MIYIGRHVGGHTLALQHGCQTSFCLYCQMFDSYAQMCCKRYHVIFSTFPLKFKCKICVQKEVIHNYKKKNISHLVTRPATNLLILSKWCRFEKPNHYYYFFLNMNHVTFIFIKAMSQASHSANGLLHTDDESLPRLMWVEVLIGRAE